MSIGDPNSFGGPRSLLMAEQGVAPLMTLAAAVKPALPVLPRRLTVGPMVALVNMASGFADNQATDIATALQTQVDRDFGPAWDTGANVFAIPRGHSIPPGCWAIYLLDHSDQADALGYHDTDGHGLPFSRCFVQDDLADGVKPSVTISHELLEMLGDPWLTQTVAVQSDAQHLAVYAKEMCDAVEDDKFAYVIGNVWVSDFVLPAYFNPAAAPGTRLSFRDTVHTPLSVADGGYVGVLTAGPDGISGWTQLLANATSPRQRKHTPLSRSLRRWGGQPTSVGFLP